MLAVGYGFFGFTMTVVGTITLSYCMDCYHAVSDLSDSLAQSRATSTSSFFRS